jgi:uncharacterized SAM-binding protein YcdF (DUF218 family)
MARIDETAPITLAGRPLTGLSATQSTEPRAEAGSRRRGLLTETRRWLVVFSVTALLAVILLLTSLVVAIYWQARSDGSRPVDAIVVMGTAQYNGRPSPALRARLDEAYAAYESGLAPFIVVTGGKQPGDLFTEAEASRDYLVELGVPENVILMEEAGTSSWESMRNAAAVLDAEGLQEILIVSDGFHLFRVKLMARELGLDAAVRPATGGPIRQNSAAEFSYVVREAAATVQFLFFR